MKKLRNLLLTLCMAAMAFATAVSVSAAEKDFQADYFPNGKLETPEAPYITLDTGNGATMIHMHFYQPADMEKLALDIQMHESQDDGYFLEEQYGVAELDKYYQVDVKFNDGEWLSTKGTWDQLDEYGDIFYGENINCWNLTFLNMASINTSDADKLQSFAQSWLAYFDPEDPVNDFLKPYVKSVTDEVFGTIYLFDFEHTTITYRIRSCIEYINDQYGENEKRILLTSDWSPETSIGENGSQGELKAPDKIDAPVLSEFQLSANEDGSGNIEFFTVLPDSLYQAFTYQNIIKEIFDPYYVDVQVKINDGEWFSSGVANSTWMINGYRSTYVSDEQQLKVTDDAWIRVRICSTDNDEPVSEWSNIIGTKALEGEKDVTYEDDKLTGEPSEPSEPSKPSNVVTENHKCKVCGFCPVQPLGICLLIWLAIVIVVIIILIVVIKASQKRALKH